jgi:outer membrane protein assembly factor BamB
MATESVEHVEYTLLDLVFVGFNRRVLALDRDTGDVVWNWKSPAGSGFPAILVDGDRLVVSVQGYMYCLDPITGEEIWSNPLKGLGVGTACIASLHGNSGSAAAAAVIAQQQQQAAASHGAPGAV